MSCMINVKKNGNSKLLKIIKVLKNADTRTKNTAKQLIP